MISGLYANEIHESKNLSHNIEIELFLKEHRLKAVDHLLVPCENFEKVSCFIHKSFHVLSISSSNGKLDYKATSNGDRQRLEIAIPPELRQSDSLTLDIAYEGTLFEEPGSPEKEDLGETSGTIGEEGVYLSPACAWYPDIPNSLATFKITITTPAGYEAVAQGALVDKKSNTGKNYTTWEEKNVSEGCYLVAGKYKGTSVKHNGIDIYAYFFPEEEALAETYIKATTRYLDMYQKILGNYPYGKFAIVENFFQTGYGMPSFTLLGNAVVKLPFIVETSLGHEILHNWWGNSVFVDESQGNWCEGLTTYMADYYYKELAGSSESRDYRKNICRKYTNFVNEQNDFSLKYFISRSNQTTQAIGYGKTAMVFHMLRQIAGDELFYKSLREFYKRNIWQRASWKEIESVFEDTCKKDLSWFFEQWIQQKGAPFLELGKTTAEKTGSGWLTTMEVIQRDRQCRLYVPIHLKLADGEYTEIAEVKENTSRISVQTKSQPIHIAVDPHCDVFRRLSAEEIPPTVDLVLGDKDKVIAYPTGGESSSQEAYKKLAELLNDNKGVVKADTEVTETEMEQKSLFILGGLLENKLTKEIIENLPQNFSLEKLSFTANNVTYTEKGTMLFVSMKNSKNRKKGIALLFGISADAIKSAGYKIPHYGKYSYLVFHNGKNIDKAVFEVTNSPLQRYLNN
jgi:hypothetical protein